MEKFQPKVPCSYYKRYHKSKPKPSVSPDTAYFTNPLSVSQKPPKTKKEDFHISDRFSLVKKFTESYKVPTQKYHDYLETSRSLIVSSKDATLTDRTHLKSKYIPLPSKSHDFLPEFGGNKNETYIHQKTPQSTPKTYHFSQFLQMAKKEKERHIPAFSLMYTTKGSNFHNKNDHSIIEELRQTEDTIPENSNIYMSCSPKASDFHQVRLLGKGKNGQVYLAIHKATGFACAMKIIKKADINKGTASEKQILYNQLLREIKLQLHMSHANLIELYCVFADKENIYLVEELGIDGQLYDLMRKRFKFSQESTAIIGRQVLKGLKYMHERQIIHRDIKPENIVLIYGVAKLCDFGWSVYCPLEMRSTLCGTPLYLSPQVLIGDQYNEKIDIWAFGTLIFELFTGDNPFNIKSRCDLRKIVTDELDFSHNFPRRLRSFLEAILKKKSSQRPTAVELQKHQFLRKYAQLQTSQQLANL